MNACREFWQTSVVLDCGNWSSTRGAIFSLPNTMSEKLWVSATWCSHSLPYTGLRTSQEQAMILWPRTWILLTHGQTNRKRDKSFKHINTELNSGLPLKWTRAVKWAFNSLTVLTESNICHIYIIFCWRPFGIDKTNGKEIILP